MLKRKLIEVNEDLNVIRNEGRQVFLSKGKSDFSKIQHDYKDEKKGFILWKDTLE